MDVRLGQLGKILSIEETLLEIVADFKLVQSAKTFVPSVVTLFGILTEVKLLHPLKAFESIVVTLEGIETEVIL